MVGTVPRGLRPGRPRGRVPVSAAEAAPPGPVPPEPAPPAAVLPAAWATRATPSSVASFIFGPPGSAVVVGPDASGCGHISQTSVRAAWKVSDPCGKTIPYLRSIERGCDRTEI